jgi:hypothetical protein
MMEWVAVLVPVLVALIGGPIMFTMHRFDKRNSEQHGKSMDVLERHRSRRRRGQR